MSIKDFTYTLIQYFWPIILIGILGTSLIIKDYWIKHHD